MDDIYISKQQAAKAFQEYHDADVELFGVEIPECFDAQLAIEIMDEVPAADVVSRDAFNRLLAENDTMRAQLARIGKKPGDSMDDAMLGVYTVKEALNNYSVDVTKLWQTATDQKAALDAAYVRGKNAAYKQTAAKDDPYKPLWPNWED